MKTKCRELAEKAAKARAEYEKSKARFLKSGLRPGKLSDKTQNLEMLAQIAHDEFMKNCRELN